MESSNPVRPAEGETLNLGSIYLLLQQNKDGSWGIAQHNGSSTRKSPMIYDNVGAAHRAHSRVKNSVLVKVTNMELSYE